MISKEEVIKGYGTAESRWARFGPYYAMFPVDFAFDVVEKYSDIGDYIIDPFAGRASSVYAGGVLGRHSLGIEINPVGWLYGKVKLQPANKRDVLNRLQSVYKERYEHEDRLQNLPDFFHVCYCREVLCFLLAAKKNLNWKDSNVDATLMSIILVYLHAKLGEGLSNQMRMTKAMGMEYSLNWWHKNGLSVPPEVNPLELLTKKIEWRYKKGEPTLTDSAVVFGDSTVELKGIVNKALDKGIRFSLLFTSPPYFSVTDYHTDQWLRLWMLGGSERPKKTGKKYKGRFVNKQAYHDLLDTVFKLSSKVMAEKNTVYIRTDKRKYTYNTTLEVLEKYFPNHKCEIINKPLKADTKTQTKLYGDTSMKPGEVDIILSS